jgi:hypothetical protein
MAYSGTFGIHPRISAVATPETVLEIFFVHVNDFVCYNVTFRRRVYLEYCTDLVKTIMSNEKERKVDAAVIGHFKALSRLLT